MPSNHYIGRNFNVLDNYDQGYVVAEEESYQEAYDEGYAEAESLSSADDSYDEGLADGQKEGREKFLEDLGPYISEAIEALAGLAENSPYYKALILEKLHDRNLR